MASRDICQDLVVGLELGHYRVGAKIGKGGMGDVYCAQDEHLPRKVAIKVLPSGVLNDPSTRKHFRKEALALSRLNHPNIATIYDFDTQQDVDFLVMEFVPGTTLKEKLAGGPLPEKKVISLGTQLADGLSAAHEHGVVHRDLKPANLRLAADGRLKILDFGLAMLRFPVSGSTPTESQSEPRTIAGTLPYMAPEQLMCGEIDARTDIYQAGAVLYEMATGQRPFAEQEHPQLIGAILHKSPLSPRTLNPSLSPEIERILKKCLEKEAESRYQSAKELAIDFRRLELNREIAPSTTEAVMAQSTPPMSSRWRMLLLVSAAILVLVILTTGLWRNFARRNSQRVMTTSIAVLPFADLSPGKDQEYFSDGLAEEILNDLAKLPNLRVVARTSAFQFKGKNEDVGVIKQRLHVDNVLEGSVRRDGTRVRITAQLVKADDGFHLWSESYDRDVKDVLALQAEIADAVASALQVKLVAGNSLAAMATSRTTDPQAYQDLLQARYFERRGDEKSQRRALELVGRAIEADPRYAAAYALRASMVIDFGGVGWTDYPQAIEDGRRDAEKAIALDTNLADGYRVLSRIQAFAESNCRAAEITLKRALEFDPGNANNLSWAAFIANCLGRQKEAVGLLNQALALDPLVAGRYRQLAQYLHNMGHYQEAHLLLAKAVELNPNETWTHETWGEVYLAQERPREALAEMEKEPAGGCLPDLGMALAYHSLGRHRASDASLSNLIRTNANGCAYQIAEVYAYRGEKSQSFAWLNRAYRQRDPGLCLLKTDLLLKKIRDDARYIQVLQTLNLAE